MHEGCEVHAVSCEVHAVFHEVHALAEGVFKGNPNVLLTKHVPPACEHLLLILEELALGWSQKWLKALKQRGISPPSRSSIAGSCHRWTDGLLASNAYIGQIVHELA
jgi:hypothetical protein